MHGLLFSLRAAGVQSETSGLGLRLAGKQNNNSSMVQRLGFLAFTEAARVRLPVGEGIQFYENYFFAFFTTLQCYAYRLPLSFQDQSLVGYSKAMMV